MQWWMDAFRIVAFQATWVVAILWLFDGTRHVTLKPVNRAALLRLGAGALLCAFLSGFALWVARTTDVAGLPREPAAAALPANWGADLDPQTREKNSRTYASIAFASSGVLLTYVDKSGSWKPFCPSEQDIAARHHAVVATERMGQISQDAVHEALRWWVSALVAVVLGAFARRRGGSV